MKKPAVFQSNSSSWRGQVKGCLDVTNSQSVRLVRLPMWFGISTQQHHCVVEALEQARMVGRKSDERA
jgi:dTDP-4-amino-4,6-dideoxygalactose transaminase